MPLVVTMKNLDSHSGGCTDVSVVVVVVVTVGWPHVSPDVTVTVYKIC
jgi:hypothetical protein